MEELAPSVPIPDIEDIVAPLAPTGNEWLLYAAIAAGILALALVIFALTRRRTPSSRQDYDPQRSAMDQLHKLKEEYTRVPPNECALRVSHAVREYLFAFHDPGAPYETSGEVLRTLSQNARPLPPASLESLGKLLEDCDLLQYARAENADRRRLATIEAALAFIRDDSTRRASAPPPTPNPEPAHADSPAA